MSDIKTEEDDEEDSEWEEEILEDSGLSSPSSSSSTSSSSSSSSSSPTSTEFFNFISLPVFQSKINAIIQYIHNVSLKSMDESLLLLLECNWRTDRIEELLFGEKRAELLKKSGLVPDGFKSPQFPADDRECNICSELKKNGQFINFPCGCSFCRSCVAEYVAFHAGQIRIPCMSAGCSRLMLPSLVKSLLSVPHLKLYEKSIQNEYIKSKGGKMRSCPSCDTVAEMKDVYPDCICPCGKEFCIHCGELPHSPATCAHFKNWNLLTVGGQAMVDWLALNTRACPHCGQVGNLAPEHKDGCNHITCGRGTKQGCGYEFCYVCLAKWEGIHPRTPYNCPTPPPVTENAEIKSRLDYNEHYFKLVDIEEKQLRRTQNTHTSRADPMVRAYLEVSGYPLDKCQFIKTAFDTLVTCRKILRNSLIYGHGMGPKHPQKAFFEFIQDDLIKLAGQLDVMLQNADKDIKSTNADEMIRLTGVVQKSMKSLNEMLLKGSFH